MENKAKPYYITGIVYTNVHSESPHHPSSPIPFSYNFVSVRCLTTLTRSFFYSLFSHSVRPFFFFVFFLGLFTFCHFSFFSASHSNLFSRLLDVQLDLRYNLSLPSLMEPESIVPYTHRPDRNKLPVYTFGLFGNNKNRGKAHAPRF